jgi:predicted membrane chloride channel (bestrophin family)
MILRERPSGLKLFLPLFNIALATAVTFTHGMLFQFKVTLTAILFTLIGLPLAIFLGFRNTTAHDRYWEARKLWAEPQPFEAMMDALADNDLCRQAAARLADPSRAVEVSA